MQTINSAADQIDAAEEARIEREQITGIIGERLQSLLDEAKSSRTQLEQRWAKNLRQFNGIYETAVIESIQARGGSEAFVNLTRSKVNTLVAKLTDMLMPANDKNWGLSPTKIPDMVQISASEQQTADPAQQAADACTAMETLIEDQLQECNYHDVGRQCLFDGALYGVGIIKGPIVRAVKKTQWRKIETDQGPIQAGVIAFEQVPAVEPVSPWDFFPDMSARSVEDAQYIFQRHLLNKKQLRKLKQQPGFGDFADVIDELLESGATSGESSSDTARRAATGITQASTTDFFEVWEYHGELEIEELVACGVDAGVECSDAVPVVAWMCDSRIIKVALNPLDSGDAPYSLFIPEPDGDSLIGGHGIPELMRSSQEAANAAWRMVMDNAALAAVPQIVFNNGMIAPIDGDYTVRPGKKWMAQAPNVDLRAAFQAIEIPCRIDLLMSLFQTAMQLTDTETAMPLIAQGGMSPEMTKTAQGMTLLMNSVHTITRRIVKAYDDGITSPTIKRFYEWNMQFSPDESVKGDCNILARGTSALLEAESQSKTLLDITQMFVSVPPFAANTKWSEMQREIMRSRRLDPDKFIPTEAEIQAKKEAEAQQQGQQPQDPQIAIQQATLQLKQAELQLKAQEIQSKERIEQMHNQAAMQATTLRAQAEIESARQRGVDSQLVQQGQIASVQADIAMHDKEMQVRVAEAQMQSEQDMQKIQAEIGKVRMKTDAENQRFNAEIQTKMQLGSGI